MIKYLFALVSIMLGAAAQYLFKVGVGAIGQSGATPVRIARDAAASLPLWGGIVCYGVSLLLWFYVLSQMELSKAYPLVSLGYVFTLFIGYFLLGEAITPAKVIGISLIIAGVAVLTR